MKSNQSKRKSSAMPLVKVVFDMKGRMERVHLCQAPSKADVKLTRTQRHALRLLGRTKPFREWKAETKREFAGHAAIYFDLVSNLIRIVIGEGGPRRSYLAWYAGKMCLVVE